MLSKKLAALAAVSLVAASTAANAQSAASLSTSSPAIERAGVEAEGSSQLVGTTAWILGAVALGLVIWGIIEITDDGDDEPTSP